MRRVVGLALCLPALGLVVATWLLTDAEVVPVATVCVGLTFVVLGTYLAFRVSGNAIGWLMLLYGLLLGTTTFLDSYVLAGLPNADWLGWLAHWLWIPQVAVLGALIPLLFPDGTLPGKKWRWVVPAAIVGWIGFGFGNAFTPELLDDYGLPNPTSVELLGWVTGSLQLIGFLGLISAIGGGVTAAISRFRRSSGQLRQQMKWFVFAAGLLAASFIVNGVLYETGSRQLGRILVVMASAVLAVAIAIAVLRYRLYDIDKIVSRTLAYAILVVVLGAIFGAGVVVLPNMIIEDSAPPLAVAGTTLVVAALFNPLRKRLQRAVDHRFHRSTYNAELIMDLFAASLRDKVESEQVVDGWADVVSKTMQPSALGVWLR